MLPCVDRALVKSSEAIIESQIMPYPFETESSIADWHYRTGQKYMDAKKVIRALMQNVSRNGATFARRDARGKPTVNIVNRGSGPAAIDVLIVR